MYYTSVDPKYYLVGAQSSGMVDGIQMCIFFYILQEGVLGHKKLRRQKLYRRSCKDAFSAADGSVEMAVNFPEFFLASLSVPITLLLFPASLFGCCFEKACDFVPLKLDFKCSSIFFMRSVPSSASPGQCACNFEVTASARLRTLTDTSDEHSLSNVSWSIFK